MNESLLTSQAQLPTGGTAHYRGWLVTGGETHWWEGWLTSWRTTHLWGSDPLVGGMAP